MKNKLFESEILYQGLEYEDKTKHTTLYFLGDDAIETGNALKPSYEEPYVIVTYELVKQPSGEDAVRILSVSSLPNFYGECFTKEHMFNRRYTASMINRLIEDIELKATEFYY